MPEFDSQRAYRYHYSTIERTIMKRVTGLGGVFFKCDDPEKMKEWYKNHLGIDAGQYGAVFKWRSPEDKEIMCTTAWNPFSRKSEYFAPSRKEHMFNYRVENLRELIDALRAEGVEIVGEIQEYDYGKFGWIMDPEGNKIELWEPVDEKL
jgi:predicted enzyme related to lactoylglutathione lyase